MRKYKPVVEDGSGGKTDASWVSENKKADYTKCSNLYSTLKILTYFLNFVGTTHK